MSIKKISKDQPIDFKFDNENLKKAEKIIRNYPEGKQQSAVMPLLYLAQKQKVLWWKSVDKNEKWVRNCRRN